MAYPKEENAGEKAMGKLFEGVADPMPKKDKPMPEESGEDEELPPGFADAAGEFLDASLPMDQRIRALKTAIHLCYSEEA